MTVSDPGDPFPPLSPGQRLVVTAQLALDCPADQLWSFIRDMENYPLWFAGITRMESADDLPIATVGKRYFENALGPGGREEQIGVEVIVANEARRHLAIQADLAPFLPRFDYRVIEVDSGHCRFCWRSVTTSRSAKARLLRPIFRRILWGRLQRSLDNLRLIMTRPADQVMRAARVWRFGSARSVVRIVDHAARPAPKPGQLLVRQHASSVNHIDCHRRSGYGRNAMRVRGALNFPIVLGNDVAGTVAAVGPGVKGFAPGDAIIAVKPPSSDGAFADFVAVDAKWAVHKPAHLSFAEAAALPYTFYTACAALLGDAGLTAAKAPARRIFVQGGGGGVGSMAVQIAAFWGATVAASCAADQKDRVQALGAKHVFDYASEDFAAQLTDIDIALCTASLNEMDRMAGILKSGADARLVTVIHPTLQLTDDLGLLRGLLAAKRMKRKENSVLAGEGKSVHWTLFKPTPAAAALFGDMLDRNAIQPIIDQIFPFTQLAAAQERLESGQAAGKVIVRFD